MIQKRQPHSELPRLDKHIDVIISLPRISTAKCQNIQYSNHAN